MLEFLIWTHGARKGLATAPRTTDADYLTETAGGRGRKHRVFSEEQLRHPYGASG